MGGGGGGGCPLIRAYSLIRSNTVGPIHLYPGGKYLRYKTDHMVKLRYP